MNIDNTENYDESFYYSKIIDPAEFNRTMTEEHLYIAEADNYIVEMLRENIKSLAQPEIVELGCGPGRLLVSICKSIPKANISAIDIDLEFLNYAKKLIASSNVKFFAADAAKYRHDALVDVFISQGVHHHVAKGQKTEQYLKNVFDQLKIGGCYILSDEFLPNYNSAIEREIQTIIWHSHIIADLIRKKHFYLAQEEAKTLLDDIYEGRSNPSIKSFAQIECVLKAVEEIDDLTCQGKLVKVNEAAKILLENLEIMHTLARVGDNKIELSREDFKICCNEFLNEIKNIGFAMESCKEFGDFKTYGGFAVWILRKI